MNALFISWNCIGWQSLLLLGVSFVSGLRGRQPLTSRIQVIVIGVAGTMLLNPIRVAAVAALEATWGHLPAPIFHAYRATIPVLGWLFTFSIAIRRAVFVPPAAANVGVDTLS